MTELKSLGRPAAPLVRLVLLALLVPMAACGPRPADYVAVERLTDLLPIAEVDQETGRIDLGTESARPLLGPGWSSDEEGGDGSTFVWSEGPESEVRFVLAEPRDLELRLACEPFTFPGAPEQAVTFVVNGDEVGRLRVPPGPGEHVARLPEEALRARAKSRSAKPLRRSGPRSRPPSSRWRRPPCAPPSRRARPCAAVRTFSST